MFSRISTNYLNSVMYRTESLKTFDAEVTGGSGRRQLAGMWHHVGMAHVCVRVKTYCHSIYNARPCLSDINTTLCGIGSSELGSHGRRGRCLTPESSPGPRLCSRFQACAHILKMLVIKSEVWFYLLYFISAFRFI